MMFFWYVTLIFGIIFFVLGILSLLKIKKYNLKGKIYAWLVSIFSLVMILGSGVTEIVCKGICHIN